ncbi:MAG TPA: autotransporter assembly complex family protein [Gammaproteobacteria bacterium]
MRGALTILLLSLCGLVHAAGQAVEISVEVSGVEDAQRENVLAFLDIYQYRDKEVLTEAMIRRMHANAPEQIRRALMPFGFYRAEVEAGLRRAGDTWQASYVIRPGPPVRVQSVDVRVHADAATRELFADLIAEPPVSPGEVLRHEEYEGFKNALMNRATQHGYLDAQFSVSRLEVNTDTLNANIELVLQPGPRFYFGEVVIEQDILDDDFLRRYLEFRPGDPLDFDKLLDLQYALADSEYFSVVQVEALREQADEDRRVPIRVHAEPNERTRYTAGIGYGTDTGPRISLGMQRRYVNRRGHRLGVQTQFSEIETAFSIRYAIPLEDPADEYFQLFAGTIREELADTESNRTVLGASRVRTLGDWEQTLYLRAEREDSVLPEETFRTESLIPGASWLKTEADSLFYTRDGYKLYFDLHGSGKALGSRTEYLQLHVQAKRILPLGERWRLLLRAEAATTLLGDTSRLPVSQRFFAGGDYSVRGYDYNSLAPRDEEGRVIGGQYFATGSAEIEYRFANNWAVAGFVDAGNAMNDLDAELRRAYGVGVRWLSPVGVVRFDVAKPVNPIVEPAIGVEIHISVGPDL